MSNQVSLPEINQSRVLSISAIDEVFHDALNYAHECGMIGLSVKIIQFPNESNKHTAISLAKLKRADGKMFEYVDDTDSNNVPKYATDDMVNISLERAIINVIVNAYNIYNFIGSNIGSLVGTGFGDLIYGSRKNVR